MKKLLKIMFGAVAAASVMCGLAACDGGDGECEHVWNEGETTVAATCTEDGVLTYTCTLCDEERTEPIARLGHDFTGEWQKDAQGHWHKCSRCEAADDVVAHTMEEGEVITPATEEEEGTQKIVCSVCGYESIKTLPVLVGHSAASEWSSDDTYHWHVCTAHGDCGMQLDKSEHDWTETDRVEATETANGKVTYECSVCKAAKEEILYYDGHVAATEWSSDKTHHWHKCTAHENCAEQMDKAEHDWDDGEVTKAATCAQKGEKTFTCETCGATKTEEIPQLAHDFSEEWSSDAEGHWHKCKNCDATDTKAAHDMIYKNDEASGKHIGECKVCGYKGSPADHVWGEGEVTKPATLYAKGERTFTCECGAKKTETIAAGADFAADFTVENQDGAWSYGKAEVTAWEADKFAFKFTAATDKNADSWLIGGLAIKSGWVNADGTLAIGYKVEKDIIAQIRAEFKGTNATSRTSLRLAVMRGGALAGTAQFAADENSNAVSLDRTVSLKAGDVLYFIINKEGTDGMGALNVTLTPATEEQSKHTASQEWSHDESSHWKTCASHLYCTERLEMSAHVTECSAVDETNHKTACECGYELVESHQWDDGEITKEATCTEKGERTFTCADCKAKKTEEIDLLDHSFDDVWHFKEGDLEKHYHMCGSCDAYDGGEVHDWAETDRVDATEDADGYVTYECEACGGEKTETLFYGEHVAAGEWSHDDLNHWHACTAHENCAEKMDIAEHEWGEGTVTVPATLYTNGQVTYTCMCGATKTEGLPARADFASDFTLENQDGAWIYGKADVTEWSAEGFAFGFVAATDKNADSWLIDGMEIKSGWVNAAGTLAIGYKVEKNIIANVSASFAGAGQNSRVSLRLAVMRGEALAGTVQFAADESGNEVSIEKLVSLKAGDVLYIIVNREGDDGMGELDILLAPAAEEDCAHVASEVWRYSDDGHWKACASHLYCTEQLEMSAHVTECSAVDETNHKTACECGYELVEPHEWDEGEITKEATCTEKGERTFTCTGCGATRTEEIAVLAHSFDAVWHFKEGDLEKHYHMCGSCDAYDGGEVHDWAETDRVDATEDADGYVTYECEACGGEKTETLFYGEHVAAGEWSHDDLNHWHACTAHENCAEKMDIAEHEWGEGRVISEATCTEKGETEYECTVCGATKTEETELLEHEFSEEWLHDDDYHWHKCSNCNALSEEIAHETVWVQDAESGKHYGECPVCGYESELTDHAWDEGAVTVPATLYNDGERTFTCACGATRKETIAARADFASDFTLENQGGAWIYGKANITNWSDYQFALEFIAATDKNADSWLIDGMEIKSGWVNAAGTLAIGYRVEQDIAADISLAFSGVDENSRASIRLVVMGGNGALRIPVQFGYDGNSNEVSLERTVSLKAGDTIYIIVNRENVDGVQTNGMGELSIALEPAGAVADFGGDFSLENQDGAWSYGKAEYFWGDSEDFTFVKASDKNSDGDGWAADGVEIKKDFISFGGMAAIGYTAKIDVTLRATVTVCGSTADTRADLRVGIKGVDGTTKGKPSFINNPDGNILYVTVNITLKAGETVYFLFSNGASENSDAIPNGNLYITLTEVQA